MKNKLLNEKSYILEKFINQIYNDRYKISFDSFLREPRWSEGRRSFRAYFRAICGRNEAFGRRDVITIK